MNDPSSIADLPHRARGLLIGAAVGDALGWPQEQRSGIVGGQRARHVEPKLEFRGWQRWGGTQFSKYEDPVIGGQYSDDTQLLLATARSCLKGEDWYAWFTSVELPAWPVYQRGGGRAVLKAARSWESEQAPWDGAAQSVKSYFEAGANGVAMRIAPHVLATLDDDSVKPLISRVVLDGIGTHGHVRALLGAVVHALTLRHAMRRQGTMEYGDLIAELIDSPAWTDFDSAAARLPREWMNKFEGMSGGSFRESWLETSKEVMALLQICQDSLQRAALADDEKTLNALGCFDTKVNGSGTVTAVAACYLAARFAARPSMGLLRSAFLLGADTDTLASMTSSILGALHGPDWLGSLADDVQDAQYIRETSDMLVSASKRYAATSRPVGRGAVKDWVSSLTAGREMRAFVDGRAVSDVHVHGLKSATKQKMERYKLVLVDGQTLIIDRRIGREKLDQSEDVPRVSGQLEFPPAHSQAVPTRIAVHVADLSKTRSFYADVLGVHAPESQQVIYVTPWLAFLQHPNMPGDLKSGPVQITVSTPDTRRVRMLVEKLKIPTIPPGPRDVEGSLRVIDPDGNEVLVWPTGREQRRP
ncbi:ADP-ribosylglycohydrolase family protein [Streptomyces sp. NPDC060027]|uniref:ADP-ribosylglycohydrolase family protein n=1 Tax=Streptomyces sp. NPDC060027 TaxID=3347040 RepID=UPI0036884AF9